MKILHLCYDGNFINDIVPAFNKFYPQRNIFLVSKEKSKCRFLKDDSNFQYCPFTEKNYRRIEQLCIESDVKSIVLHGLHRSNINLLSYLVKRRNYDVYWIFWGYELYVSLAEEGKYDLLDKPLHFYSYKSYIYPGKYNVFLRKILNKEVMSDNLKKAFPLINYFCFWNYEDYLLLQEKYQTDIKFKYFVYQANFRENHISPLPYQPTKKENMILINHQASLSGNHLTIIKRIAEIDILNNYKKLVPLSYGFNSIRKLVMKRCTKIFGKQFIPLLSYMPKEEYVKLISSSSVAIIGCKRQEAAGNIIALLKNGVKVFLRNKNNLLTYYKKKGYIIFSFEDDLKSTNDLLPLSLEEQKHNYQCACKNLIFYDDFMPSLIDNK